MGDDLLRVERILRLDPSTGVDLQNKFRLSNSSLHARQIDNGYQAFLHQIQYGLLANISTYNEETDLKTEYSNVLKSAFHVDVDDVRDRDFKVTVGTMNFSSLDMVTMVNRQGKDTQYKDTTVYKEDSSSIQPTHNVTAPSNVNQSSDATSHILAPETSSQLPLPYPPATSSSRKRNKPDRYSETRSTIAESTDSGSFAPTRTDIALHMCRRIGEVLYILVAEISELKLAKPISEMVRKQRQAVVQTVLYLLIGYEMCQLRIGLRIVNETFGRVILHFTAVDSWEIWIEVSDDFLRPEGTPATMTIYEFLNHSNFLSSIPHSLSAINHAAHETMSNPGESSSGRSSNAHANLRPPNVVSGPTSPYTSPMQNQSWATVPGKIRYYQVNMSVANELYDTLCAGLRDLEDQYVYHKGTPAADDASDCQEFVDRPVNLIHHVQISKENDNLTGQILKMHRPKRCDDKDDEENEDPTSDPPPKSKKTMKKSGKSGKSGTHKGLGEKSGSQKGGGGKNNAFGGSQDIGAALKGLRSETDHQCMSSQVAAPRTRSGSGTGSFRSLHTPTLAVIFPRSNKRLSTQSTLSVPDMEPSHDLEKTFEVRDSKVLSTSLSPPVSDLDEIWAHVRGRQYTSYLSSPPLQPIYDGGSVELSTSSQVTQDDNDEDEVDQLASVPSWIYNIRVRLVSAHEMSEEIGRRPSR